MSNSEEFCFLCKDNFSPLKSKIKVLGKSARDIPSLILKATKEDVNVNVERERFYICQMKCFNWLVRYQNALRKVEEISFEVQDVSPAALAAALTLRIVVTSFARPPVFSFGSVSPIPGIQNSGLIQKAFCDSQQLPSIHVQVAAKRTLWVIPEISWTFQTW